MRTSLWQALLSGLSDCTLQTSRLYRPCRQLRPRPLQVLWAVQALPLRDAFVISARGTDDHSRRTSPLYSYRMARRRDMTIEVSVSSICICSQKDLTSLPDIPADSILQNTNIGLVVSTHQQSNRKTKPGSAKPSNLVRARAQRQSDSMVCGYLDSHSHSLEQLKEVRHADIAVSL